jgi:hypothetical protein
MIKQVATMSPFDVQPPLLILVGCLIMVFMLTKLKDGLNFCAPNVNLIESKIVLVIWAKWENVKI